MIEAWKIPIHLSASSISLKSVWGPDSQGNGTTASHSTANRAVAQKGAWRCPNLARQHKAREPWLCDQPTRRCHGVGICSSWILPSETYQNIVIQPFNPIQPYNSSKPMRTRDLVNVGGDTSKRCGAPNVLQPSQGATFCILWGGTLTWAKRGPWCFSHHPMVHQQLGYTVLRFYDAASTP